jgi:hypothetical protein
MLYRAASAWSEVDPRIARFVLEDFTRFLQEGRGRESGMLGRYYPGPESGNRASFLDLLGANILMYKDGEYIVPPDWRSHEEVQEYVLSKGYRLDEAGNARD